MRVLSFEQLRTQKGIEYSRVHLWRLVNSSQFPAPIKLGPGRNAWVESEIDSWLSDRVAERDAVRDPEPEPADAA